MSLPAAAEARVDLPARVFPMKMTPRLPVGMD